MGSKLHKMIKDNKVFIIMCFVIWVIVEVLLIAPIASSIVLCQKMTGLENNGFLVTLYDEIASFKSITRVFNSQFFPTFKTTTIYGTIIYLIIFIFGMLKAKPKHEFTNIEHGSSDWSEGGEQYKVLSRNKGIILAEHNYLPVDKIGNVNVLVVGRFWFW